MFAKDEGAINATLTTELLIKAARDAGANIQLGNEVLSFMTNGSRVAGVVAATGNITADMVVLTAGTATSTLCKSLALELPVNSSPSILMEFHTPHQFINRVVSNPLIEVRPASDTLIVAAEDYIDESRKNNPQAIAERTADKIIKQWWGPEQIKLTKLMAEIRPIPRNGLPVIGRAPGIEGLYLSVMHSGITLAAIAGRLAAADILSSQDNILLSSYHPWLV